MSNELTPIELENNLGPDVDGVEHRVPWKAYDIDEVDALLASKDKAITELKAEIKRKEGVGQRWFERCMTERTENCRLRRALWLARAERAKEHYHRYHGKFLCPLEDIPEYVKWKQVERKCRAKAEQYK